MKSHHGILGCLLAVLYPVLAVLYPVVFSPDSDISGALIPLGPLPIFFAKQLWPVAFIIPMAIIAEGLVLWAWFRALGFCGNLWRAFVLYMTTQACETWMIFACPAPANWTSSIPVLLTGVIPAALLGLILYRQTSAGVWWRLGAVASATVFGYLVALSCLLWIALVIY